MQFLNQLGLLVGMVLLLLVSASAQVKFDGSLGDFGSNGANAATLAGPVFYIEEADGKLVQRNLFHSFEELNADLNEAIVFNGQTFVQNILVRVTGDNVTAIDGLIWSPIPAANLFLMNPNGIIIGPNGEIDVEGAFAATTADRLILDDGAVFAVSGKGDANLSSAPVASFGFLSPSPSKIVAEDQSLLVATGGNGTVSLVGGDLSISGSTVEANGAVRLVSVGSAGTATFDIRDQDSTFDSQAFSKMGKIRLTDTTVSSRGLIWLAAESISMDGGRIVSRTGFGIETGRIQIDAGSLEVTGRGVIESEGFLGGGGPIEIAVDQVRLLRSSSIDSISFGSGAGGDIVINAGTLEVNGFSSITADAFDDGVGGSISIEAGLVRVKGGFISAGTVLGVGRGGRIEIRADTLEVVDKGTIDTSSSSPGSGGSIFVEADTILIDGTGSFASISSEADDEGDAGSIELKITGSDTLRLRGDASISTESTGSGTAGSISIESAGLIQLDDESSISVLSQKTDAGNILISSQGDIVLNNSSISARAGNDAGNIEISAENLIWLTDSQITAEAGGNGGNVILRDAAIALLNGSLISANAIQGNGGFIQIGTGALLTNNSRITASSDLGVDGEVRVDGVSDLRGAQIGLEEGLLDASNQLQDRCTVRIPGERGSFVLVGRGGLPVMPGRFLPAQQLLKLEED